MYISMAGRACLMIGAISGSSMAILKAVVENDTTAGHISTIAFGTLVGSAAGAVAPTRAGTLIVNRLVPAAIIAYNIPSVASTVIDTCIETMGTIKASINTSFDTVSSEDNNCQEPPAGSASPSP